MASRGWRGPSSASTAAVGATQITLLQAPNWRVGDRIVLASTDFDPFQAEEVTITAISGTCGERSTRRCAMPTGA